MSSLGESPESDRRSRVLVYCASSQSADAKFQRVAGELGSALADRTIQNSKKTSSVVVPTYAIARLRLGVSVFLEIDRLKFDHTTYLRILGNGENVAEELQDTDKTMRLRIVRGVRGFSETGVSVAIDQAKHVSLSVSLKYGQVLI